MSRRSVLGLVGALAALGVGVIAGGASATWASPSGGGKKVEIKGKGQNLRFDAPRGIRKAAQLQVENLTRPNAVGPHTFSLIKGSLTPKGRRQIRRCANFRLPVCEKIFDSHEVDPDVFEVEERIVDLGKEGWDRKATKKRGGDSWYTDAKGETHARPVTAPAGTTLHFICLVHPRMQGKVKVKR